MSRAHPSRVPISPPEGGHADTLAASVRMERRDPGVAMNENVTFDSDFEVAEVERKARPGCNNSSSTNPRCTCIPIIVPEDRT
jgi:hypothetical protein